MQSFDFFTIWYELYDSQIMKTIQFYQNMQHQVSLIHETQESC